MKLQEKTSLILISLLIVILTLIIIFVSSVSLSSYSALENRYVQQDVAEAVHRLDSETDALSAIASDWAQWDDTYAYVGGDEPGYVSGNLVPGIYDNLRINLILMANEQGEVVYAGAYNGTARSLVAVPAEVGQYLTRESPLMNMNEPLQTTAGIVLLDGRPMIVASCPIVHSDLSGTPRGVVIMGRYLDNSAAAITGASSRQTLRFLPVGDPSIPSGRLRALESPGIPGTIIAVPLEQNKIAGYAVIRDIFGNDSLVLELMEPRDLYEQGVMSTTQYVLIVLAAGLLLGVVTMFILDRLVLSPVTSLSRQVHEIGRPTASHGRVRVEGSDEFTELSREINLMLETIEKTHDGLVQSETRFRELAELLPQIIFEMDTEGTLSYVNRAGLDIFDIDADILHNGTNVRHYIIPEDHERMNRGLAQLAAGKRSTGEIYHLRTRTGSVMSAIVYAAPVHRNGQMDGFRGIAIDITERVNLEEALIESQEYLQTLLMSVSVGILVIDAETHTIIDTNPAALDMIGTTRDRIINQSCHNIVCPTEVGRCPITDLGFQADNTQSTLLTSDGRRLSIIRHVVPVMLHGRSCLLETFIDNTARVQMQEELQKSRERLSGILRASPVGVFEAGTEGTLIYVNERWEEMIGMTLETMNQRHWADVHMPLDKARISKEMWRKFQTRMQSQSEYRFMKPDGTIIWLYGQSVPVYDSDGKVRGFVGTITDITDRKRIEDAIHLANKKLNLMNDITRHDILNTITGIFGLIDMAVASGNKEELSQLLGQIKEEGVLIQRQITFTRDYQGVGVNAPLWQNVREVAGRAIKNVIHPGVAIVIDIEDTEIFADPLLEKVFYNLVDNALRYGEQVSTIRFYYQISDSGLALICEDDGVGVPEGAKGRIFERGVGKNTGMGLFLTREILRITSISIKENGIPGRGARFEMLIPNGMWRFVSTQNEG